MATKSNIYRSIKQGLVHPNILFTAAYLLFSAEVCTGALKNKPNGYSAHVPLLSLAAKPVDQLDTMERLAQFEVNPYWLDLCHANRSPLSINVSTPSSKLISEKVAAGEIAPKKVAVVPSVEEERIAGSAGVVKQPTEVAAEGLAASISSPETHKDFDNVNPSDKTIKITFNPIQPKKFGIKSLAPVVTKCFAANATLSNSLPALDVPTDNRSVDKANKNDAPQDVQEHKIIQ
ncbi:hypothetical protein ACRRVB_04065 [Candidatus Cardinium hertigii]|uniref:hypothetical protein n=1 Tax=Candidatus Cardinium hertigii TaxID=247481 RepID=UPI003D7E09C0